MTLVHCENYEAFFAQLNAEIQERLDFEPARRMTVFSRLFFESFPLEELEAANLRDIYASTYFFWNQFQKLDRSKPRVQVFNPTLEEHGWTSDYTIVAVFACDMPFLMDSLRLALDRRNIPINMLHSSVFEVERNTQFELVDFWGPDPSTDINRERIAPREALIYLEIHRHSSISDFEAIAQDLDSVIADVSLAVEDFDTMRSRARKLLEDLEKSPPDCIPPADIEESRAFIAWMLDDHFTFLGVTEVVSTMESGGRAIREDTERRLGLLKKHQRRKSIEFLHEMNPRAASLWLEPRLLGFAKSSVRSTVHRSVYSDYVTVKQFDEDGQVARETRFLGLFTSRAYTQSPFRIPVVRRKLEAVMAQEHVQPNRHQGRYLEHVLESYPRDELFQIGVSTLAKIATGITRLHERKQVRLFVRRDDYGRYYSCIVYVPRDLYHTELRLKMSDILCEALGSDEVEFTTYFSDSVLARTHFVLRVDPMVEVDFDRKSVERRIVEAAKTWEQRFEEALTTSLGAEKGASLAREFASGFPAGYIEDFDARVAVRDVQTIIGLEQGPDIGMSFSREIEDPENRLRFKLFQLDNIVTLSDVIPILENLGVRVIGEHPYPITRRNGRKIWIHDFELEYVFADSVDLHYVKDSFPEAFRNIWLGRADSDGFNRLILGTHLGWREATILRTYARYMKQTGFPFSIQYIAQTLSRHLNVAEDLVALFHAHFDPRQYGQKGGDSERERMEARINDDLETVESLDEDRIIRRYVTLIKNTLRTNFYQRDSAGNPKAWLSFKLAPRSIPDLPKPLPRFEIFVHSARTEGVHLRWGRVARGGIRWSDRQEDYRTEILGLVKAQQVKNAVIVPVGAKGGFITRRATNGQSRDAIQQEGVACYRQFIQGLLDVTDNYVNGEIVSPPGVAHRDQPDPYLVVAADKGTAKFSDIANEIAEQYNFWLGDGFAAGGSIGYDHKKMGITARGAWVSVQQHFQEMSIDVQKDSISVVGIGDMSGDVFGNGMLLSDKLKLVAAFNHAHIFIDPNPKPLESFEERKRLFALDRSAWSDYDATIISEGGGVYSRSAKSIAISPEVRARFNIEETVLDPNGLISALLKAPVDLIFNGGIGTYIKAERETHAEVRDKANDALRIDASQLQCRVLCEGGNLGITQLGRIEYCLAGGRANTDFIDNAAGVNCSDHEVNVKILLGEALARGELTEKQRRQILEDTAQSVSQMVLRDSFRQVQAISVAETQSTRRMGEHRRYISALSDAGLLDREIEFIPEDDELVERKAAGKSLTRPEISLLVSYTKAILKEEFCCDEISNDEIIVTAVESAFPQELNERFSEEIYTHRLKREIIATQIANEIVNRMGFTFVYRMRESTGASSAEIAKAYVATREIFDLEARFEEVERLGATTSTYVQVWLMGEIMGLARRCCRWLLRNRRGALRPSVEIEHFSEGIRRITETLPERLTGQPLAEWTERKKKVRAAGVPDSLASFLAHAPNLHSCFALIEAAGSTGADPEVAAGVYFQLGERLDLQWFRVQIAQLRVDDHWQALSRENCLDDLDWQERALTVSILRFMEVGEDPTEVIGRWLERHSPSAQRWNAMLTDLHSGDSLDLPMCSVALRELLDWAQTASHQG
ncbi:MAG: NAD-glutamate dehydrogenase [Myxococcales bacterium]|nr:NAD-glutamate dehydrogenase [Myxococcales bacterium]